MTYFTRNQGFPLGIDLSQHNASWDGKTIPNFDQIRQNEPKVRFAALRTGISWGYRDSMFERFFREAVRIDLCILPYHVFYPTADPKRQMQAFLNILCNKELDKLRLVLDLELDQGKSKAQITDSLNQAIEVLSQASGRYPIIYSRALWIDEHLEIKDLPQIDWWLAQYIRSRETPLYTPEYPCPPLLPRGVRQWLIHQTAQRAPAIGGVGHYMDYNRWNGSVEQLWSYFGRKTQAEACCPLDGLPCERASKALAGKREEVLA